MVETCWNPLNNGWTTYCIKSINWCRISSYGPFFHGMSTKSLDHRQVRSPDSGALGCDTGSTPSNKRVLQERWHVLIGEKLGVEPLFVWGYLVFWQFVSSQIRSSMSWIFLNAHHIMSHRYVLDLKQNKWHGDLVCVTGHAERCTLTPAEPRPLEASNQTWGVLFLTGA